MTPTYAEAGPALPCDPQLGNQHRTRFRQRRRDVSTTPWTSLPSCSFVNLKCPDAEQCFAVSQDEHVNEVPAKISLTHSPASRSDPSAGSHVIIIETWYIIRQSDPLFAFLPLQSPRHISDSQFSSPAFRLFWKKYISATSAIWHPGWCPVDSDFLLGTFLFIVFHFPLRIVRGRLSPLHSSTVNEICHCLRLIRFDTLCNCYNPRNLR